MAFALHETFHKTQLFSKDRQQECRLLECKKGDSRRAPVRALWDGMEENKDRVCSLSMY